MGVPKKTIGEEEKNETRVIQPRKVDLMFYPSASSFLKGIAA
jgi:hypothetical protein